MISKNAKSSILKIAKEFREKKDNGIYSTYKDAYKAAVISSKIHGLTVKKLERVYYSSKRKIKIIKNQNSKSVSIPIMITQEMRKRLKGLKYRQSDIRYFTAQKAQLIWLSDKSPIAKLDYSSWAISFETIKNNCFTLCSKNNKSDNSN